jgi:hypothetical protein
VGGGAQQVETLRGKDYAQVNVHNILSSQQEAAPSGHGYELINICGNYGRTRVIALPTQACVELPQPLVERVLLDRRSRLHVVGMGWWRGWRTSVHNPGCFPRIDHECHS